MNPLDDRLVTGTVGELLFQLRLLQYGVQAAPPLKDSGNDLIAVREGVFKAIQVKTTRLGRVQVRDVRARKFHLLGLAALDGTAQELFLDRCTLYLLPRDKIDAVRAGEEQVADYQLSQDVVDRLFV